MGADAGRVLAKVDSLVQPIVGSVRVSLIRTVRGIVQNINVQLIVPM